MRIDRSSWFGLVRVLVLAGVSALGLVSLVGSGGGLLSDCPPGTDCFPPPPPPLQAEVQPARVTALVGTPVRFSAQVANASGGLSFQWSRSSDGGASFVEIARATGSSYTLGAVNLADDGAIFLVTITGGGTFAQAMGRLVVSSVPGLVFEDGEFQVADWLVTPFALPGRPAPGHAEDRMATGGNPDAFLKMTYTQAPQTGASHVLYTSLVASYDPQTQGAVNVIDYAEDGIALQPNTLTYTQSAMLLEQGGRRYIANPQDLTDMLPTRWSAIESRSSLLPQDFSLFDGPACTAGESCPDFSAAGLPMRFGFSRVSFGSPGDTIAHGIDNWKVTVWRR